MTKSTYRTIQRYTALVLLVAILIYTTGLAQAQTGAPSVPTTFSFLTNMKQGDTVDPDVKYLQIVLNSDPRTVVATSGPGSLYEPTTTFGSLTKDAVVRFQALYANEVLKPAGLTSPTGSVGSYTRAKLNTLIRPQTLLTGSNVNYIYTTGQNLNSVPASQYFNYSATGSGTSTNPNIVIDGRGLTKVIPFSNLHYTVSSAGVRMYALPDFALAKSTSSATIKPNSQYITNLSTYRAVPLQVMSVFGSGFDQNSNNIFIGPVLIGNYKSSNTSKSQITFSIPDYIPRGFYQVAVSNVFGTSTSQNQYLVIDRASTTDAVTRPVVNSITPSETKNINDVITVNGSNFTLNNTVMTNLGNIYSLPSYDTKTITFLAGSLPYFGEAQTKYSGKSINLVTKVSNENGVSTEEPNHTLTFGNKNSTVNTEPQNSNSVAEAERLAELQAFIDARDAAANQATTTATSTTNTVASQPWNGSLNIQFAGSSNGSGNTGSNTGNSSNGNSNNSSGTNVAAAAGIAVGAVAAGSLLGAGGTSAATKGTTQTNHFGGTILQSTYCSCSGGSSLLVVDDYASNQTLNLMFQPGVSRLNMNFNIYSSGPYVIGGYMGGGGTCQIYSGTSCTTVGTAQYTIDGTRGVGTSAY